MVNKLKLEASFSPYEYLGSKNGEENFTEIYMSSYCQSRAFLNKMYQYF